MNRNQRYDLACDLKAQCTSQNMTATQHFTDEVTVVKALIESYFILVRKKLADLVPKTITMLFVNYVRDALEHELVSKIYHEVDISLLMKETFDVSMKRNNCLQISKRLSRVREDLDQIRSEIRTKR